MGQQEVYDFLKKHGNRWFKSTEIARNIRRSPSSVIVNLKSLRKGKIIDFRVFDRNYYIYRFRD